MEGTPKKVETDHFSNSKETKIRYVHKIFSKIYNFGAKFNEKYNIWYKYTKKQ